MAHFPRSTPTRALEIITNIKPLHKVIEEAGFNTYIRLKKDGALDWIGKNERQTRNTSHLRFWVDKADNFTVDVKDIDVEATINDKVLFNVNMNSLSGEKRYQVPSLINIYTDGSKIDDKVGYGFQIYKGKTEILEGKGRLNDEATVFQAEIEAIKMSALSAIKFVGDYKYMKFYTDSQAALQALADPNNKQRTVQGARKALNELKMRARYITVVWTKAHVGTTGNEKADQLAKEGSALEQIARLPLPKSYVKAKVKEMINKEWDAEWSSYEKGRMSKLFIKKPSQFPKELYKFGRKSLELTVRMLTGHNALNYFRSQIDKDTSKICRLCGRDEESFWHMCTICDALASERRELEVKHKVSKLKDIEILLKFVKTAKIRKLFDLNENNVNMEINDGNTEETSDNESVVSYNGADLLPD